MVLEPIYKDYAWGGRSIISTYDRAAPPMERYAESWELVDKGEAQSIVHNGPLAGTTLRAVIERFPFEVYGNSKTTKPFPLLVKLKDALHPTDVSLRSHPILWRILDAQPNASIYAGLKQPITKQKFIQNAGSDTILDFMHTLPVHPGDTLLIPPGSLHAIQGNVTLLEVHASDEALYRIFDWGRGRALQTEEAAKILAYDTYTKPHISPAPLHDSAQCTIRQLCSNAYFNVKTIEASASLRLNKATPEPELLFIERGAGRLIFEKEELHLTSGMSVFLPHICKKTTLETDDIAFLSIRETTSMTEEEAAHARGV